MLNLIVFHCNQISNIDENQILQSSQEERNQNIDTNTVFCATTNNLFASLIYYIAQNDIKVISIGSENPHHYQPSAMDISIIKNAKFTIVNGGHIDEWAQNICPNTCLTTDFITNIKDQHTCYSWEAITKTLTFITDQLSALMPENRTKYQERFTQLSCELDSIFEESIETDGIFISNESLSYNLLISLGIKPENIKIFPGDSLKQILAIKDTLLKEKVICFLYNDSYPITPEMESTCDFIIIKENQDRNDQDPLKNIKQICKQIRESVKKYNTGKK